MSDAAVAALMFAGLAVLTFVLLYAFYPRDKDAEN